MERPLFGKLAEAEATADVVAEDGRSTVSPLPVQLKQAGGQSAGVDPARAELPSGKVNPYGT